MDDNSDDSGTTGIVITDKACGRIPTDEGEFRVVLCHNRDAKNTWPSLWQCVRQATFSSGPF
jgi:hypothetical protein